ncbi:hypothetical protein MKEN_00751800 [Mycena kentingensis (nom. inval.)]|nr:hypothetical protein MKEN_00751800 [Mycena kentingensis (nom. inval.)]
MATKHVHIVFPSKKRDQDTYEDLSARFKEVLEHAQLGFYDATIIIDKEPTKDTTVFAKLDFAPGDYAHYPYRMYSSAAARETDKESDAIKKGQMYLYYEGSLHEQYCLRYSGFYN